MAAPSAGVEQAQTAKAKTLLGPGDQFARELAHATGLDLNVLRAWVLAEGGPADNPLNIMQFDERRRRSVAHFSDPVAATNQLLQNARYAPILRSASQGPQAQIAAITASPWEEGHYRGAPSAKPGTLLRGTYARVLNTLGIGSGVDSAVTGAVTGAVGGVLGGVTGAISDAEGWLAKSAIVALGYLSLTVLALGLILIAAWRIAGPTVMGARSASAGGSTPNMDIPY